MFKAIHYAQAIQKIRPGVGFSIDEDDYSTLLWTDVNSEKPTEEEIQIALTEIVNTFNNTEYQRLRAKEYPPLEDFADAWVKDDQQALEEYRQKCLDVKSKYPKTTV